MAEVKEKTTVEIAQERADLEAAWKGRLRYFARVEGTRTQMPETLYTEWYAPEGVEREVCVGLDDKNKPIWMPKPDAPVPPNTFETNTSAQSLHEKSPAAHTPTFDYIPPAYNSDTESGGPANFDGNAGGDNNPRNPLLEGEVADEYKAELDKYKAKLKALEDKVSELAKLKKGESSEKEPPGKKAPAKTKTGVDALKDKINGKSE